MCTMKRSKLIGLRKKSGFSQSQVAHYLNKDISTYQRMEYGRVEFTDADIINICELFQCHPDALIEDAQYLALQGKKSGMHDDITEHSFLQIIRKLLTDKEQKFICILRSIQRLQS